MSYHTGLVLVQNQAKITEEAECNILFLLFTSILAFAANTSLAQEANKTKATNALKHTFAIATPSES